MGTIASLLVKLGIDTKDYESGMGRAQKSTSGFGDVLKGMLGAAAIKQGLDSLVNLGKTAFGAAASYERLGMSLQTLVARELRNSSAVTAVTGITQTRMALTQKEIEQLGSLRGSLSDVNQQLAIQQQKMSERTGKEKTPTIMAQAAAYAKLQARQQDLTAGIAALTAKDGQLVTTTQTSTTLTLSQADALEQAKGRAQELIGWVERLAIQSPFGQEDVADALRMAMAYGFTSKEAQRLTTAMIDFAAGTGAEGESMKSISLALGQIQAKGKLAGQEVLQLVNQGLPVWDILSRKMGKSKEDLMALSEKGLIPADEAIEAIVSTMESDFAGAAKRSATSLGGLKESLQDLNKIALRNAFTPLFKTAQPYIAKAVDLLSSKEFQDSISAFGESVAQGVGTVVDKAAAVWSAFNVPGDLGYKITNGLLEVAKQIGGSDAVNAVADAIGLGKAVVASIGRGDWEGVWDLIHPQLTAGLSSMGASIKTWWEGHAAYGGGPGWVGGFKDTLTSTFADIVKDIERLSPDLAGIFTKVDTAFKTFTTVTVPEWKLAITTLDDSFPKTTAALQRERGETQKLLDELVKERERIEALRQPPSGTALPKWPSSITGGLLWMLTGQEQFYRMPGPKLFDSKWTDTLSSSVTNLYGGLVQLLVNEAAGWKMTVSEATRGNWAGAWEAIVGTIERKFEIILGTYKAEADSLSTAVPHTTTPPVGIGGLAGGFSGMVFKPTVFMAGERGPEYLQVTPYADRGANPYTNSPGLQHAPSQGTGPSGVVDDHSVTNNINFLAPVNRRDVEIGVRRALAEAGVGA